VGGVSGGGDESGGSPGVIEMKDPIALLVLCLVSFTLSFALTSLLTDVTPPMKAQMIETGCLAYNPKTGELEVKK
jgi:hypothetical protein